MCFKIAINTNTNISLKRTYSFSLFAFFCGYTFVLRILLKNVSHKKE